MSHSICFSVLHNPGGNYSLKVCSRSSLSFDSFVKVFGHCNSKLNRNKSYLLFERVCFFVSCNLLFLSWCDQWCLFDVWPFDHAKRPPDIAKCNTYRNSTPISTNKDGFVDTIFPAPFWCMHIIAAISNCTSFFAYLTAARLPWRRWENGLAILHWMVRLVHLWKATLKWCSDILQLLLLALKWMC